MHKKDILSWLRRILSKQGEKRWWFPNYVLYNYEEEQVVLKSSGTKQNDSDTNQRKVLFRGLQNLIESKIISKFNHPCGFLLIAYWK